jgi:hypothetical protein
MSALRKRPKKRQDATKTVGLCFALATLCLAGGATARTFRCEQEDGIREWNRHEI